MKTVILEAGVLLEARPLPEASRSDKTAKGRRKENTRARAAGTPRRGRWGDLFSMEGPEREPATHARLLSHCPLAQLQNVVGKKTLCHEPHLSTYEATVLQTCGVGL